MTRPYIELANGTRIYGDSKPEPEAFKSWGDLRNCWCEATPEQAAALGYEPAPPGEGGCLMLNGEGGQWLVTDEDLKETQ